MTPLRCDGCWREEPHSEEWFSARTYKGTEWDGDIQLCPSCASSFEAWLKSLREEPL